MGKTFPWASKSTTSKKRWKSTATSTSATTSTSLREKKSLLVGIKTVTTCGMLSDVDVVQGVITRCDYSTRYTNKV